MPIGINSLATSVTAHVTTFWHDRDSVHTPAAVRSVAHALIC